MSQGDYLYANGLAVQYQFCTWYWEVESGKSSHNLASRTSSVHLTSHTSFSFIHYFTWRYNHSHHPAFTPPPFTTTITTTEALPSQHPVQVVSSCVGWSFDRFVSRLGLEVEIWGLCICRPTTPPPLIARDSSRTVDDHTH